MINNGFVIRHILNLNMQIHQLKLKTKFKNERRIGRGGKRGTFSGRGTKGQRARAGAKIRPAEREILKKIPKLRGYKFSTFPKKYAAVSLREVEKKFNTGDIISPLILVQKGLVRRIKGRIPLVKIIGAGELKKKIEFKDVTFSKGVRSAIKS